MLQRDTMSWNPKIADCVNYGDFGAAWDFFYDMRRHGFLVDGYTFSHALKGIVCNGELDSAEQLYSLIIKMGCLLNVFTASALLDMYAKCGRIDDAHIVFHLIPERNFVPWNAMISGYVEQDEAKALIKSDAMVWKTLLGACRNCRDVEIASQVASHAIEIDLGDRCTYVILSDMYGRLKRWEGKASLTRLIWERGVKKVKGWSWIEINNEAQAFNAEDSSHP
ncbi:hypothetical protein Cgig2_025317 [Carnegiea gigantea]|uniref:Pentatricopeptide repeat-containing protein n=1 Tax=Carnegiea gigantea TaxID=171969 RepID=A0A9Q1K0G9_9CARY|nr:hypothetical protein Cgig2_025317 [Carnegiea gigantea]